MPVAASPAARLTARARLPHKTVAAMVAEPVGVEPKSAIARATPSARPLRAGSPTSLRGSQSTRAMSRCSPPRYAPR